MSAFDIKILHCLKNTEEVDEAIKRDSPDESNLKLVTSVNYRGYKKLSFTLSIRRQRANFCIAGK